MSPVGGGEEAVSQLQAPSEEEKEVPSEDDPIPTSPTKNLEERDTSMLKPKVSLQKMLVLTLQKVWLQIP
ncbi:pathway-specific nitrogen regulator [Sesbania bispinosa]|nr:pathway-specific nitrogen regulator [Sesbania bispinosa]